MSEVNRGVPMDALQQEVSLDQEIQTQENRRSMREQAGAIVMKVVGGVAVAATLAAGGLFLITRGGDDAPAGDKAPTAEEIVEFCDDIQFDEEVGNDSSKYNEKAFLPIASDVDNEDAVEGYLSSLFESPLGGEANMHSLAALMATVGAPAHDGAGKDVDYDYLGTYATYIQAYTAEGGEAKAAKDCQLINDTFKQIAKYNKNFLFEGDTYTTFDAVRGEGNRLTNLRQGEAVSTGTLRAIEFSKTGSSRDVDELNTIGLVLNEDGEWSGRLIATGINQGKNGKLALDGETPVEMQPTDEGEVIEVKELPNGTFEVTRADGTKETTNERPAGNCDGCGTSNTPGTNPTGPGTNPTGPGTNPTVPGSALPPITVTIPGGTTVTSAPPAPTTTQPPVTQPPRTTTTTTVPDVCPNIPGSQPVVPPGMEIRDGICKEIAPTNGGF